MTALATETAFRPGVYDGMPEDIYHGDPVPGGSLSSSGARKLLTIPPARFRYEAENPPAPTDAMERGTAAHKMVLGVGAEVVRVDAKDWRTKKAQEQRDEARERGAIPLLPPEYERVQAMAAALRADPLASALFRPGAGKPEQAAFWFDSVFGIWRRVRFDWLPDASARERLLIPDYKTTTDASPAGVRKSIINYGYHQQGDWYGAAARALLHPDPAFLLVFQETTPPYLVRVVQMDDDLLRAGRERNERAMEIYRDCSQSGMWPGYGDGIDFVKLDSLPVWAQNKALEAAQ